MAEMSSLPPVTYLLHMIVSLQVDYGTLHGAHSVPSPIDTEVMFLDQEASFFQQLSEDLGSLSSNVQSLSELGAQLLATDGALQKYVVNVCGLLTENRDAKLTCLA